ncbi:universal stress protein [Flavobacterium sp. MR2016-29]|uniref:universal stress protein n=1 Tax=Flavobacterium sp. MR2016-29 TaxID=2783795 RepID=UPI00188CCB0E|nr:universal stress protein [Flavobacterium sp. MR2016-29]MBF4492072.1 universal stress protein [Flavobacterium sp. MR2016-29]
MIKLLVTTDFSNISRAGIRFAIQFASQTPCELIFYSVNTKTFEDNIDNYYKKTTQDYKLKKFILSIYKTTKKEVGKVEFVTENNTQVDTTIIAYAEKCHADFICINTSGPGIFNHLIGTTAAKLVTTSPIPVLLVPYTYRMKPINLLLYASDLVKLGVELPFVKKFATLFAAEIAVYHYNDLLDQGDFKESFNQIAQNYKSEKVSFNFKKLNIEYSLLNHLKVDILKVKPSIIVMFTKQNRDWFERHFLSSKTKELGFDTHTPILVFRK